MLDQDKLTGVYDEMIASLDQLEVEAKAKIYNDDSLSDDDRKAELNYVTSKYEILKITSTYGLLLSTMSIYDGFIHAFLHSSENRRKFLIEHTLKVCVSESGESTQDFGKIIEKGDAGYDEKTSPAWIEWNGCLMKIPENTYILISPNATWPSVYMKSKSKDADKYNEISIHERSWNADVYATEVGLVKRLKYEEEEPVGKGVNKMELEADTDGNTKFLTVDLEVQKKLEEYDLVLEIPFRAPYMDVLTKVNFKGSANNPELLMTFALT